MLPLISNLPVYTLYVYSLTPDQMQWKFSLNAEQPVLTNSTFIQVTQEKNIIYFYG